MLAFRLELALVFVLAVGGGDNIGVEVEEGMARSEIACAGGICMLVYAWCCGDAGAECDCCEDEPYPT